MSTQGTIKKTIYRHVMNEVLFLSRVAKCFTEERALLEEKGLVTKSAATCIDLLYEICRKIPHVVREDRFIYEIAHSLREDCLDLEEVSNGFWVALDQINLITRSVCSRNVTIISRICWCVTAWSWLNLRVTVAKEYTLLFVRLSFTPTCEEIVPRRRRTHRTAENFGLAVTN